MRQVDPTPRSTHERAFQCLALTACLAAVYHALHVVGVLARDDSSIARHSLFVGINLLAAWYATRRPLWLLPAYVVLVIQQTLGHGGRAVRWWTQDGRVDGVSLVVLIALYAGLALLLYDARMRSPRIQRMLCPTSVKSPTTRV